MKTKGTRCARSPKRYRQTLKISRGKRSKAGYPQYHVSRNPKAPLTNVEKLIVSGASHPKSENATDKHHKVASRFAPAPPFIPA
ncbi:MAG TPA: hypothetical protein PK423_03155 [Clostridiales bacterium]|nr:hypothetical protein [Clostridiales bacterium]